MIVILIVFTSEYDRCVESLTMLSINVQLSIVSAVSAR